jgi:hypothetical protein
LTQLPALSENCGATFSLKPDHVAALVTDSQVSALWQPGCLSPQDAPLQALGLGTFSRWTLFLHELQ